MSEEHRRYLTVKQFEADIVTDDTMLEILYDAQILRDQELRQIRSQLTMDQRREKLFDTLKRKPDNRFTAIKAIFDIDPTSEEILTKNLFNKMKRKPDSLLTTKKAIFDINPTSINKLSKNLSILVK